MLRHSGVKPPARRWPGLRLERLLGERQLVQDSGAERRKGDLGKTRIVHGSAGRDKPSVNSEDCHGWRLTPRHNDGLIPA